jgi:hypothetical protein
MVVSDRCTYIGVRRFAPFDVGVTVPATVRTTNLDTASNTARLDLVGLMIYSLYFSLTEVRVVWVTFLVICHLCVAKYRCTAK